MASEMMDAFGQGVAVANALEDRYQKRKALGSAIQQYGDKARDPGLFAALQETDIAASREARTERESQQTMQIRGAQESRASETFTRAKTDDDMAKRQKATLGLVQGLRQARDRGEDVGAAFDKMAETLPSLGVNPDDIPAMRQAVVDNPKILDDYLAALTGGVKAPGKVGDKERARLIMNDANASAPDKQWAASVMGGKAAAKSGGEGAAPQQVSQIVGELRNVYTALNEGAGIPSAGADTVSSAFRYARSSGLGRMGGRVFSTTNEGLRQDAEGARQLLVLAVKEATGMSAQQMNSNMELQAMLNAATDPSRSFESNMNALDRIESLYGVGGGAPAAPKPGAPSAKQRIEPGFKDPDTGAVYKGGGEWEMP